MKKTTRILLIEDHEILRFGIEQLFGSVPGFAVGAAVGTGREGMERLRQGDIDLVVTDLTLPDFHGLSLTREIKLKYPKIPVIVLTMHDECCYGARAIAAGASGFLMKTEKPETIARAVRVVSEGGTFMTDSLRHRLAANPHAAARICLDVLSDRELEVLQLLGSGLGSVEVAEKLGRSVKTIEAHREHIKTKLALKNATELMRFAISLCNEGTMPSFGRADAGHTENTPTTAQ